MLKYILKKMLAMIPMLLLISMIVYFGLQTTGVDPINFLVSPDVLSANAANVEALRESLGLNDPLIVQYFRWLGNVVTGNLGYSFDGSSIAATIAVRLPYTFELAGWSLLLSAVIGVGIGIISAIRQNGIIDYVGRVLAVLGQAVPQFLVGIILIQIFAIKLGWFPSANRVSPGAANPLADAFFHLFLPVLTLTIGMVAVLMRYARNTMLDVLNSDYIKTARSKGIPEWKVYLKHGFRNAMKPVLVIILFRMSDNPAGVPPMQLEAQEKCDVLVAGCGIAGLSAALAAAEAGARVTLLCAGEVFSGSSFYPGTWGFGLIGPENADDKNDLDESILRVGCGMANPALVDTFVNGIAPAIENLRGMGVALRRAAAAGEREFIPCFDHKRRDWNGIEQASAREVFARRLEALGVKVYAECEVLELVKAEGWVCGAIVFYGGELCYLPCGAFVLATGGFGALLQHHLCTGDVMGTGQALALRAGAALTNLEFFQIMPGYLSPAYGTVFNEKAFRFSEITAGGTPLLAGEEAERLLAQRSTHGPFTARLESRAVDIALAKALETDAAGAAVRYTAAMKAAPPEFIRTYFDWLRDAKGLTMEDTVYIGHFAHAANGGVRIAPDGGTGVPGLFACGEVTGGMHGADRIGGLSTANGLVFGGIAGRAAAATGRKERALPRTAAFTPWAWDGIFAARAAMQSTMGQNAMVLRSEAGLAQAVQTLSALRGAPQRPARLALEAAASAQLSAQLLTAECIVEAAKLRKESRGAHYRIDHPEQSAACAGRIEITAAEGEISARFVYDEA